MVSFGLFALGAFIGGVIGVFLVNTTEADGWSNPIAGLSAVIGAGVSGPAVIFAGSLAGNATLSNALAVYPVGLVIGLLSPYLRYAAQNYRFSEDKNGKRLHPHRMLAIAHFIGYFALALLGLSPFFSEFVRDKFLSFDAALVCIDDQEKLQARLDAGDVALPCPSSSD